MPRVMSDKLCAVCGQPIRAGEPHSRMGIGVGVDERYRHGHSMGTVRPCLDAALARVKHLEAERAADFQNTARFVERLYAALGRELGEEEGSSFDEIVDAVAVLRSRLADEHELDRLVALTGIPRRATTMHEYVEVVAAEIADLRARLEGAGWRPVYEEPGLTRMPERVPVWIQLPARRQGEMLSHAQLGRHIGYTSDPWMTWREMTAEEHERHR